MQAKTRGRPGRSGTWLGAAIAVSCPVLHAAPELKLSPYGGAQTEYYSNLFEVADERELLTQRGVREWTDVTTRTKAGIDVRYGGEKQGLQATAEAGQVSFDKFSDLDHDEYRFGGRFSWQLASAADGDLQYWQDRHMAAFSDLDVSELALLEQRTGAASINFHVTPTWHVVAGAQALDSELPLLPRFPDFQLQETHGYTGLKYTVGTTVAGLRVEYGTGEYTGGPNDAEFTQLGLKGTFDYEIPGLSKFNAESGFVHREDEPFNGAPSEEVNDVEAEARYTREISDKTSVDGEAFRRVSSFVAGGNSLIESGLRIGGSWKTTYKLTTHAHYAWTHSEFVTGQDGAAGRKDQYGVATLDFSYQLFEWLLMRAFGEFRDRDSNIHEEQFTADIVGLELRARLSR